MELLEYPHPMLSEVSKHVENIDDDFRKWAKEAEDFCDGITDRFPKRNVAGMAAPQLGNPVRAFVVTGAFTGLSGKYIWFVNPLITWVPKGGKVSKMEGCYSLEEDRYDYPTWRYYALRMKWQDLDGNHHEEKFTGNAAWVIQHEVDHLNGICVNHPSHKE